MCRRSRRPARRRRPASAGADGVHGGDRHDAVPGVVHRRPDQVVHRRVEHDEAAALVPASPAPPRRAARPAGPTSQRPGSTATPDIQVVERAADRAGQCRRAAAPVRRGRGCPGRRRNRRVSTGWPAARRARTRSASRAIGRAIRRQRQDLAADMHRKPDRLDPRQRRRARDTARPRRAYGMPNLSCARPVVILACVPASTSGLTRNATRAVRPMRGGERREHVQLLGALHVDLGDVLGQREAQLALRSCRRRKTRCARPGCRPRARGAARLRSPRRRRRLRRANSAQHRQMVVRLHRVVDVRVQSGLGERAGQHAIAAAHGSMPNTPRSACPSASAIGLSGTPSIISPSIACMARCGRAAISSAIEGSADSPEAGAGWAHRDMLRQRDGEASPGEAPRPSLARSAVRAVPDRSPGPRAGRHPGPRGSSARAPSPRRTQYPPGRD